MIVNTKGIVARPPEEWIKKEGLYTFKVIKVSEDGFSNDGHPKIKMIFKSNTNEQMSEIFIISPDALWKLKMLEIALKAPESYDVNDFVNHYFVGEVKRRIYKEKEYFDIKKFEHSPLNDKVPPVPEREENSINVDDEEAPF